MWTLKSISFKREERFAWKCTESKLVLYIDPERFQFAGLCVPFFPSEKCMAWDSTGVKEAGANKYTSLGQTDVGSSQTWKPWTWPLRSVNTVEFWLSLSTHWTVTSRPLTSEAASVTTEAVSMDDQAWPVLSRCTYVLRTLVEAFTSGTKLLKSVILALVAMSYSFSLRF